MPGSGGRSGVPEEYQGREQAYSHHTSEPDLLGGTAAGTDEQVNADNRHRDEPGEDGCHYSRSNGQDTFADPAGGGPTVSWRCCTGHLRDSLPTLLGRASSEAGLSLSLCA